MAIHFDQNSIAKIKDEYIVIDTNVLSDIASDVAFYKDFVTIFDQNPILIDPIVRLEFLRGAYIESTYREKTEFLKYEKFMKMVDHQDIYKKVYDIAFDIARIYSHNKNPQVPLGDILVTARLKVQENCYFLTEDNKDFSTLLFDRLAVFSFERINKDRQEYLQHLQLLRFNTNKFDKCLKNLPQ